jgi:puromycin-sensitive aminopeptidase
LSKSQTHRRLDPAVRPRTVHVHVTVDPARSRAFRGHVEMQIELERARQVIRLHAVDLRVSKARLESADTLHPVELTALPEAEMIELRCATRVPAGPATLHLSFSGRLRTDLCGLYGARAGERRYAFTQLEAAEARKFFPCFDEPAMKARFSLSVTTGKQNTAVSNGPLQRTERHTNGTKTLHFAQTPPLSTYLVALAVGELEASRPVCVGPTQIRVWHTPGQRRLTGFGLEAARACLERLEGYFGIPYPYAKLDLIAVPDFEFGAMENAGAVFFRETLLLLDPKTATIGEKKRAAEVICHELAHMWYGDLVTMAWWDDLWLNEAFATWMAFAIVDQWQPDWKMWQDFQHGTASALELDALQHTHPIYCRVRTPDDANENFDRITYEKGAAVVRMVERYLGAATFRRGVRNYIRTHREGNTVAADLWNALSDASGEDVEALVRPWIEQEGYPVVSIRRTGGAVEFRQQRFVEQPRRGGSSAQRWPIPWVGRIGHGRRGRGKLERRLLRAKRERVSLPVGRFLYGNADEGGFFRPLHEPQEIKRLAQSLASLNPVERMGLVDHQWALVRAGSAPMGTLLDLIDGFADEADPDVLATLRRPLGFVSDSLVPNAAPKCDDAFRAWVRARFEPAFDQLGWKPAAREADDVRLRRAMLLTLAGGVGGSTVVVQAAEQQCARYLASPRALDANLADSVLALSARNGDAKLHRAFAAAMSDAKTPQAQRRFLLALCAFETPELIDRTLALTLTDSVATQDVVFVLARSFANPAAREQTWQFVTKRWSGLRKRMPPLLASRLIDSTAVLLTPAYRREVSAFFRANPLPSGERALRQTLERFRWYAGFRSEAAARLREWLDAKENAEWDG